MSLVIEHLVKQFPNTAVPTLNDISLTIEPGQFICVVGQSGCGKSTLLNLIAGLDMPTSGKICLDGQPITGPGVERAVMFQDHGLYPWLTVIENVKFGMKLAGTPKAIQEKKAIEYLEMVHLAEYKDYRIHQISGGMRQRVALARALTLNSKMLLMDEPFSALDKKTSNLLREELQTIWQKTHKTIFFITHSVEEAVYLADRVVVLLPGAGRIKAIKDIDLPRPRHVYDADFVALRHELLDLVRGGDKRL